MGPFGPKWAHMGPNRLGWAHIGPHSEIGLKKIVGPYGHILWGLLPKNEPFSKWAQIGDGAPCLGPFWLRREIFGPIFFNPD